MGAKEYKVVISGAKKGSKLAFLFIDFLIGKGNIKPIFVNPNSKIPSSFDGLIITGGADINPLLYSKSVDKSVKNIDSKRDKLELKLLDIAVKKELPILGICRGMQLINIYFGGTLHQDIAKLNLKYPHKNSVFPIKKIKILKDTKLYKIVNKTTIYVNAIHHQSVDKLGKNLRVNAYDKNKIVEGIESIDKNFLIGVQWHPEYIFYKRESKKLFSSFVRAVKFK